MRLPSTAWDLHGHVRTRRRGVGLAIGPARRSWRPCEDAALVRTRWFPCLHPISPRCAPRPRKSSDTTNGPAASGQMALCVGDVGEDGGDGAQWSSKSSDGVACARRLGGRAKGGRVRVSGVLPCLYRSPVKRPLRASERPLPRASSAGVGRGQPVVDGGAQGRRRLVLRDVADTRDLDVAGARDRAGDLASPHRPADVVVLADEDEGRAGDRREQRPVIVGLEAGPPTRPGPGGAPGARGGSAPGGPAPARGPARRR